MTISVNQKIPSRTAEILASDDAVLRDKWKKIERWGEARFEKKPSIEALLFLTGLHAMGRGYESKMRKEVKQDVIMNGAHHAFEAIGLYCKKTAGDEEAWVRTEDEAELTIIQQEKLIRSGIVAYFERHLF